MNLPVALGAVAAIVLGSLVSAPWSFAGGGPENVFLLVNSKSQDSMTVANHYIALRKIPATNVHYLEWDKEKPRVSGQVFRDKILLPALREIDARKLGGQIDYLIYSCDFPWKVNFAKDFPGEKFTPGYQPRGSTTGSTYLWAFVKDKRKEMFGLAPNNYYSMPKGGMTVSHAFRTQYRWLPNGQRTDFKGVPYLLSMMLGVTYGRGSTVEEIIRYLQIASTADATHPKGTIYYVKNKGPRSTPRHNLFPQAVRELGLAGVRAEILEGDYPKNKKDVMGATTGVAAFNVARTGCRLLPGALWDNLTSSGGVFDIKNSQTPLTDYLRYGAAGACGTVHEPLNYPQKFPSPFLHVHYAHGCSLAEAFYQSIHAPFQQLIVGDPLCQPWAYFPEVRVDGVKSGAFVSGTITITPSGAIATPSVAEGRSRQIRFFELFVDGVRRKRCRPGGDFRLDTTALADGYHELRVVAIDNTPIETQGRWTGDVIVKNGRNAVQLSVENQEQLGRVKQVAFRVTSTGKGNIAIMHNGRRLAEVSSGNGIARIGVALLGSGPITLQAVAEGELSIRSKPVRIVLP